MVGSGALEVLLLGPLELRRAGEQLRVGRGKQRLLLAVLAVHVNEVVSVDRLMDDVWGERPPPTAQHGVEVYVSQLRRVVGPTLATRPPGYVLELEPDCIDLFRFARRTAEGCGLVASDPDSAAALLRDALALWRGRPLAEFAFEPFAQTEIARLEELRRECLEGRIDADLRLGRYAELVPELEALVRDDPLRERARAQLMRALYGSGRSSEALEVYRTGRVELVEALGIEPGPELRDVQAAILRQDESLLVPTPAAARGARPHRRLVTVVAAELAGLEALDAEALYAQIADWREEAAALIGRHGGRIASGAEDAIVAVFGATGTREDDLLRATRAALELRGAGVRVGIDTGEVAAGGELVAGPAVAAARAAARAGAPGEIVVGPTSAALLGPAAQLGPRSTLVALDDDAPATARRLDAPFVGRRAEVSALVTALDGVTAAGSPAAVVIAGAAGTGKTRLALELSSDARLLRGACAVEGAGSPYRPLRRIVADAAGGVERAAIAASLQDDRAAGVLADAVASEAGTTSPAEVSWAFRRFCEALAEDGPLVVVLDDLQWAEPTLLELAEQLVGLARGPILLVCITREELRLAGAQRVALEGLSPEETASLLEQLGAASSLSESLRARVVESAEGNPLFLEQLVAFVAEEGTLVDRPLPPTIQALLAARLDRLGPGERAVLSRAAVAGREFRLTDVAALLDPHAGPTLLRHLQTLERRGFVRARGGMHHFRHVLVQEAAYRATARSERAELHERLADRLTAAGEPDEIVGFHLERAHVLQAELGASERRLRQLAADAGLRLGAAGIAAWKRNDVAATIGLLRRATSLLDAGSPSARELTCELGVALRAGGDAAGAIAALEEASRPRSSAAEAHLELRARMELAFVRLLEGGRARDHELVELAETAIPIFEAVEDERALGRAWLLSSYVHTGRHLRCLAGGEAAELALVHYQRAAWPPATCLGLLAHALYLGPTPVGAAASRCEELLSTVATGPAAEANVSVYLAGLLAMVGRFDDARALVARARVLFEDLGQLGAVGSLCGEMLGAIESLAGDASAAESAFRASCELLLASGLTSTFASRAGELAAVLNAQGRHDEALEWARVAERAGSADDVHARLAWQSAQAQALARTAGRREAEPLARAVVAAAEETDALNRRAAVFLAAAEAMELEEAVALRARARAEYERKGNTAALARLAEAARV